MPGRDWTSAGEAEMVSGGDEKRFAMSETREFERLWRASEAECC